MSTSIDTIVDLEVSLDEAPELANRVIETLCCRGIILRTPQVHEYLGNGPLYATGPKVAAVADHNDRFPCGMDVKIGHQVFTAGENGLKNLTCPRCNCSYGPAELDWAAAVVQWCDRIESGLLKCCGCGHAESVATWNFEPAWGFGNLAFAFLEWQLKEDFVGKVAQILGHRIAWVKSYW